MTTHRITGSIAALSAALAVVAVGEPDAGGSDWRVVANSGNAIPGHPERTFNSFNPPSVNDRGLVVFRARSTGRPEGPVSGIFVRDAGDVAGSIGLIADRDATVPEPNNTRYPIPGGGGETALSTFNEFPSFPRIALRADAVATRGNHPPVWTWTPDEGAEAAADAHDGEEEEEEERLGNTGVYVNLAAGGPGRGPLVTGASVLGIVGQSDYVDLTYLFRVPGVEPVTRFEVFPGAPAITDEHLIAFKGNYSVAAGGRTGVFWRRVVGDYAGGNEPVHLVANSDMVVPNRGACAPGTTFGSTAPPSAADGRVVFVGLDDEAAPTCGGIYRARMRHGPQRLEVLVGLETEVPDHKGETFARVGEGLSYDGRFVGFWGAWGEETRMLRLHCPEEGNRVRREFCNHAGEFAPDPATGEIRGDPLSVCDDLTDPRYPVCYQEKPVPVHQGIFVLDTVTGQLRAAALAGPDAPYDDFVYWNYSGAPPGAGHGEGHAEPPRFRSAAFAAVATRAGATYRAVYLGRRGALDPSTHTWVDPVDGVYLVETLGASAPLTSTLIETGMDGTVLDPDAVWDHDENSATPEEALPVAGLALERDGLRGRWLALAASMGEDEAGWAGIYALELEPPPGGRP
jgi:hypothetical protein